MKPKQNKPRREVSGILVANIFLVIAALGTIWVTHQDFVKSERPYVAMDIPHPFVVKDGRYAIDIEYKNFGKSPAVHIRTLYTVIQYADVDEWFESIGKPYFKADQTLTDSDTILPPNVGNPSFSTWRSAKMPAEQIRKILSLSGAVTVVSHASYEDDVGNSYTTDFCARHLATGAMLNCDHHNEML